MRSEGPDRGGLEFAVTVHGWAQAGLLDTYEVSRSATDSWRQPCS
jgi:hypothetical protein